jgi:UDPglucose 6-dehydrogenase
VNVAVVGTGYVGLVVGACLAETGNSVICADVNGGKIDQLKKNKIPIHEPGLGPLVTDNQAAGRLTFTTDVGAAVEASEIVFIAVGTPPDEDGSADLQHVLAVAETIGDHMNSPKVVITKSTVPVGTAEKVRATIAAHTSTEFHVCSNPEFLKEGAAVDDFMKPDRVVVGVDSEKAAEILSELYAPFVRTGNPLIFMDIPSAEVTKYAANAMLATRISFMNQVAELCEKVGADVHLVRKGIGSDSRIGPAFLFPGPGYGGSCFPKDVRALLKTGEDVDVPLDVLESVEAVNERQKHKLFQKVKDLLDGDLTGKSVAVWGLAFKAESTCLRSRGRRQRQEDLRGSNPLLLERVRGSGRGGRPGHRHGVAGISEPRLPSYPSRHATAHHR